MSLPPNLRVFERGWLSSNNVLFLGPDENVIVDTGYASHAEQTVALVRQALGAAPLHRILNTHLHSDHCGGNAALQRAWPEVVTAIPPGQSEAVRRWDETVLSYAATGQRCERFRFEALLLPGATVTLGGLAWDVHAAPGHDPDSVILHAPAAGLLLSADALWENGFGVIFPELVGESGFEEEGAVLALIAGLDVRTVIPGHGPPFTDVAGALARARSRLDALQRDPRRHAMHALKVLIMFLLMERRSLTLGEARAVFGRADYFRRMTVHHFAGDVDAALEAVLRELAGAGHLRRDAQRLSIA